MGDFDDIFQEPALQATPPVLVDVGASGGAHATWRKIAPFAIGLGFDPDRRETAVTGVTQSIFRRWILSDKLIVADEALKSTKLYLTRYPHCSSTLPPNEAALAEWSFAELFETVDSRTC